MALPSTGKISNDLHVMIADDDPIFRRLLVAKLTPMVGAVHEAENGREAWELASANLFHLAIVDLEMPELDGNTLIQCLRAHPRTKHVPIVVCSSHESRNAIQGAIEAGASSFITKPLNWSLFESHVRHLLLLSSQASEGSEARARNESLLGAKNALVTGLRAELATRLGAIAALADPARPIADLKRLTEIKATAGVAQTMLELIARSNDLLTHAGAGDHAPLTLSKAMDWVIAQSAGLAASRRVTIVSKPLLPAGLELAHGASVAEALRLATHHVIYGAAEGSTISIMAHMPPEAIGGIGGIAIDMAEENGTTTGADVAVMLAHPPSGLVDLHRTRGLGPAFGLQLARLLLLGHGGELMAMANAKPYLRAFAPVVGGSRPAMPIAPLAPAGLAKAS